MPSIEMAQQVGPGNTSQPESRRAGKGGLRVNNSLHPTSTVPFHTADLVTWYICGPTVYDASHMGHARTYLTFDIIRRILEDYFDYHVFYVMNVTDVDDKIIKRARQNHLVDQFCEQATDREEVFIFVEKELQRSSQSQAQKVADARAAHAKAKELGSKQESELKNQLEQEELKGNQLEKARSDLQKASSAPGSDREAIRRFIEIGRDPAAAALDAEKGSEVTDLSIFQAHGAKYEREFFDEMKALGIRPPDVICRVTQYIDSIIKYVEKIIERGLAYTRNGSVYFNTAAFREAGHTYGKLCPWAVGSAQLASESEANFESSEKLNKNDFALWKAGKPGEPAWSSPWGKGRPGWHIECSAMASDLIGDTIDVHSGGMDLKFPHHDNEVAQAEAYFGSHEWVRYWFHTGHLQIDGLKMSKSLKNFITINEALQRYTARQIRLLFLYQAWDKPMKFGEGAMEDAKTKEKKFREFFHNVQAASREAGSQEEVQWDMEERELQKELLTAKIKVRVRLEDNFDTPGAMQAIETLVKSVYDYLGKAAADVRRPHVRLVRNCAEQVHRLFSVFGLVAGAGEQLGFGVPGAGGSAQSSGVDLESTLAPILDSFTKFRADVRKAARGPGEKGTHTGPNGDRQGGSLEGANGRSSMTTSSTSNQLEPLQAELLLLTDDVRASLTALGVDFVENEGTDSLPCVDPSSTWKLHSEQNKSLLAPYLHVYFGFWVAVRKKARAGSPKDVFLTLTDTVRDVPLTELGVRLEDRADGSSLWKLDDPQVLKQERREKLDAARKKLEGKRDAKKKEVEKWEAASVEPSEVFRRAGKYSSFDEQGHPSHDADGKPISDKARKKIVDPVMKAYQGYQKKMAEDKDFLDSLKVELSDLDQKLEAGE